MYDNRITLAMMERDATAKTTATYTISCSPNYAASDSILNHLESSDLAKHSTQNDISRSAEQRCVKNDPKCRMRGKNDGLNSQVQALNARSHPMPEAIHGSALGQNKEEAKKRYDRE